MKRKLALLLAVLFVIALFAGCGGKTNGGSTNTNTKQDSGTTDTSGNTGKTDSKTEDSGSDDAVQEDEGPYKLAPGKYEVDENGWPLDFYEYELPLSTTDEVFTNMTLCFTPQYLPEDGYDGLPMYSGREELTGVHMEYNLIAASTFTTTLAVQEAGDDLDDVIAGYWAYHSGSSLNEVIDDNIIVNLYDYREYIPNYCRYAIEFQWVDAMWGYVNMPSTEKWIGFMGFYDVPCQTTGYFMRGDWLDELGMDAYEPNTYDQWHDMLMAVKVAGYCDYPLIIYSNIDAYANVWNGFNTSPYSASCLYNRVVDGVVSFNGTTEDDKVLLQYISGWYNEGLIDPNFQSVSTTEDVQNVVNNSKCACTFFNPSEVTGYESSNIDQDCRYDVMKKLVVNEGDIIHWHLDPDEFGGCGASVAASCENIPLLLTYLDWCYSPTGADWCNYGPEGTYWNYNEDGEKEWNETMTSFEMGVGWATMCYLQNPMDAGVNMWTRNYKYEGGERLLHFFEVWNEAMDYYDGAYNYPAAIKLTDEQSDEVNALRADADTYFSETYVLFFTGEKAWAEWDSFQQTLGEMGMDRITEIYQENYDAYMAA